VARDPRELLACIGVPLWFPLLRGLRPGEACSAKRQENRRSTLVAGRSSGPSASALRLVGFHVGSEDGVDPGLVALSLPFEPVQHIGIQPEGHHLLACRHADLRVPEEVLVQFRDAGRVDLGVRRSRQSLPVSPRLLCSIRPSHRSSADPIRTACPWCIYRMYVRQEEFRQGKLGIRRTPSPDGFRSALRQRGPSARPAAFARGQRRP